MEKDRRETKDIVSLTSKTSFFYRMYYSRPDSFLSLRFGLLDNSLPQSGTHHRDSTSLVVPVTFNRGKIKSWVRDKGLKFYKIQSCSKYVNGRLSFLFIF